MATLWIREYSQGGLASVAPNLNRGTVVPRPLPIPQEPGTDQTPVTYSTSAQSAAFAATTNFIGIISGDAFHYVVGANPTATVSALKVPANTLVHIGVTPGQKIAAIAAA